MLKWDEHPKIEARFDELLQENLTYSEIASIMSKEFNRKFTSNQLSKRLYNTNRNRSIINSLAGELDTKGNTTIIENSNGINISGDVMIDDDVDITSDYLMELFGYSKSEFVVTNSSATVWDAPTSGGKQKMYRCKLTVKRKVIQLSDEDLVNIINNVKVVDNIQKVQTSKRYTLVIPLYDKHFGISTLSDYENELHEICQVIESMSNECSIVIALGGDLFHNDSIIHGQTTRGTQIDKVDMFKAIEDFSTYMSTIIEESLKATSDVSVVSVAGNHDTTTGYIVTEMIKAKYPQCNWHTARRESQLWRRAILINDVMLGFTHGDKATANIDRVFANEFPKEWGLATSRDIYIGHLHSKKEVQVMTENRDGVTVRRMPSSNKLDDYHIQNGFTSAKSQTVLVIYENGRVKKELYI